MFISIRALRAVLSAGEKLGLPIRKCWGGCLGESGALCVDWVTIVRWLGLDKGLGYLTLKECTCVHLLECSLVRASLPITYRPTVAGNMGGFRQATLQDA